ncbi:MAG: DNA gyrase C-terminal beta-propeller domain-containing protein [Myxococcota bacterium]
MVLREKIADLKALLASTSGSSRSSSRSLREVEKFGDERRTELAPAIDGITNEDLIVEEDKAVTLSHLGYIKRNPVHALPRPTSRGQGRQGMATRDEDFVRHPASPRPTPTCSSSRTSGRLHWLKVRTSLPQPAARRRAVRRS